jgi:hypothetical protein
MYYAKGTSVDIDMLFSRYTTDLAHALWMELNGHEHMVENIESECWYKDGVVNI